MRFGMTLLVMSLCVAFVGTASAATPLVTGDLALYYSFDSVGVEGEFVTDDSGNGYDGEIVGNVQEVPGLFGNGASMWDEANDIPWINATAIPGIEDKMDADWNFIDLPVLEMNADDNIPTSGLTLAVWYKTQRALTTYGLTSSAQATLCPNTDELLYPNSGRDDPSWPLHAEVKGSVDATGDHYRYQARSPGQTDIGQIKPGNVDPNEGPNWDVWTHIAFTYDAASNMMKFYENGMLLEELDTGILGIDMPDNWDIGARVGVNVDYGRQFLGTLDEVYLFTRAITSAEVKLLATPDALMGDADLDGDVDADDLTIVADNWLATDVVWQSGDFNADNVVDGADLTLLAAAWTATNAAIPEPSSVVLLIGLVGLLGLMRRRS